MFIKSGLSKNELDLKTATENFNSNDEIVKTAIEHSFRIYVLQNIVGAIHIYLWDFVDLLN